MTIQFVSKALDFQVCFDFFIYFVIVTKRIIFLTEVVKNKKMPLSSDQDFT